MTVEKDIKATYSILEKTYLRLAQIKRCALGEQMAIVGLDSQIGSMYRRNYDKNWSR
jgi:hypothetical protein